jgi:flagellar motility protein MotE (MotC chaperone)
MIKKTIILIVVALGLMVSGGAVLHALDKQPIRAITPGDLAKALELKEREAALVTKEAEIAKREQTQEQVQKELDAKLAKLTSIQSDLKDQLAAIKGAETAEFTNLIKIYSVMSPSKVAPLLDSMDDPAVVKIFRAMKVDQVAKIMPKLKQEKAVAVSQGLGLIDRQ